MDPQTLIPHLFRTEFSKLTSVLCRRWGIEHLELAEDIVSDTFLLAAETWGLKGIPENPRAWLYTVARNKARDVQRREQLFQEKISPQLRHPEQEAAFEIDLSPQSLSDSQLQMMFAICQPAIPLSAQIGLALRILCGFGICEIADAFLSSPATINKRLFRAKTILREAALPLAFPPPQEIAARLDAVLRTLYLLFNEGYYSASHDVPLRKDLCLEAMRLCQLLLENPLTAQPTVHALLSLMCFHASRFEARFQTEGAAILYEAQDRSRWDQELILQGERLLNAAATGQQLSKYHLEAAIAYWHTRPTESPEKWEAILQLYNHLLQVEYSPIAALNRTYALAKARDIGTAIAEAQKLPLKGHHLYHALLGELWRSMDPAQARVHFQEALSLARTPADQQELQRKIDQLC